ncbi:MAG TPA: alpha-L-fucosidase [Clostridia bacterium]|nr:alpha-L-fucosidase [Clostridia bacterium]
MAGFEPTFDSLSTFECPDWFRNAKFGIWSHWGPQSVPMCGDWYARNMYIQDSPQYLYHLRHYGHPSEFGYKDICALWKAENFDPDALMALYKKAGARYFVAQAMHHDHFFNYPSKLNRMNAAQVGPKKDICGLWRAAAQRQGLPFGLTEHLGASFSWWRVNKGADAYGPYKGVPYDGNDPAWRDFYFDNAALCDGTTQARPWYADNPAYHRYWVSAMKELIDLYTPELLYTDGALPFGEHWHDAGQGMGRENPAYQSGLEVVSYLYNASAKKHGANQAVYTQKDRRPEIYGIGVLDIEKSQLPGIADRPWQTDTCIGNWFYDAKAPFKRPGHIIEMLVDIISKNGTMLLNILQRPDGTIDAQARHILEEIAAWFACCGEGVHDTRPFRVPSEGATQVTIKGFTEEQAPWTPSDFRFTQKGGTLYAFMMAAPESRVAVIQTLCGGERAAGVRLLGAGELPFEQSFGVLTVKLPEKLPTEYTNCLAIQLS